MKLRTVSSLAIVAIIFYFALFSGLGSLGLLGPDEPRYAAVAREMSERGDWVTPYLNGQPWFEKPILYYWMAAAAFKAFGVSEITARLPCAILAALATLAMAFHASRFYGEDSRDAVLLLLPTSVGVIGFARGATTDMPFSALLAISLVFACRILWPNTPGLPEGNAQRTEMRWTVAFGAALGLATLAKGPAAVILAGGSALLWMAATRRWRDGFRLLHPAAIGSFMFVALPWYILCAIRNPDFVNVFLISHNVERFLTPAFQHQQPFWFYVPILMLGLFPWTFLLLGMIRDTTNWWRKSEWKDSPSFFFACWILFPLIFFSISKSKLPGYILPVIPPLGVLLARSYAHAVSERTSLTRLLPIGIGAAFVGLGISARQWLKKLPPDATIVSGNELVLLVILALAAGLVIAGFGLLRQSRIAFLLAAVLMTGLLEWTNRTFVPRLDIHVSSRATSQMLKAEKQHAGEIHVYRLHRAWQYGLNFYMHRELPVWTPQSARPARIVTSPDGAQELLGKPLRARVLAHPARQAIVVLIEKD